MQAERKKKTEALQYQEVLKKPCFVKTIVGGLVHSRGIF